MLKHHSSIIKPNGKSSWSALAHKNGEVKFWQRLVNNMPAYFPYYASIMLHAYYASNYASIIGWGLIPLHANFQRQGI